MSALAGIGRRIRRRQPQAARTETSIPLAKGLKGLWGCVGNGPLIDCYHNRIPSSFSTTVGLGTSGIGAANSGSQQITFAYHPDYSLSSGTGITIACLFDLAALTNYSALIACQDSTTQNGWELRLGATATNSIINFLRASGSGYTAFNSAGQQFAAPSSNQFLAVMSDYIMTDAPNANVNGALVAFSSSSGSGTGSMTFSSSSLYLTTRLDSVTVLDGTLYFAAIWNRQLTFNETEAVRLNPWQLFE